MRVIHFGSLLIAAQLFAALLPAAEYHLSPDGDDSADGSVAAPWRTLARASQFAAEPGFKPGDAILLAAGKRFTGKLVLIAPTIGLAGRPITIASSGPEPATIDAGAETAVETTDIGGLVIRRLNLVGTAVAKGKNCGLAINAQSGNGERYPAVVVEDVNATGFSKYGIAIGSWGRTYAGFDGVTISRCQATGNGDTGITIYDQAHKDDLGKYAHRGLLISDSIASENRSGSGFVLCGVDGGLMERCRAHRNRGKGGGVGIWTYSARNVVIQHCISDQNKTGGKDGGGFDIDGGSESCVVQYCYSYGNDGMGFMHCDYPNSRPTVNNTIRWCISENDGRKGGDDATFAYVSWGEGIADCVIENCVGRGVAKNNGRMVGLWSQVLRGYGKSPRIERCVFRNNIVSMHGPMDLLARIDRPEGGGVTFQGNLYWAATAPTRWQDGEKEALSLAEWRAMGFERDGGRDLGACADPMFVGSDGMGEVTAVETLQGATAYRVKAGSPATGLGVVPGPIPGIAPAKKDFSGTQLRQEASISAGAYVVP